MSKEEKKRRETEQLQILKNIISSNYIQAPLEPLKKAQQNLNIISKLERNVKYFPETDKKENLVSKFNIKIKQFSFLIKDKNGKRRKKKLQFKRRTNQRQQ